MYDVYDIDTGLWACWDARKGYLSEWMPERKYLKWYWVHYGCLGRKIPGLRTLYRGEADEKEAKRVHHHR